MATYTAPTTRSTGDLVTASIWNTDMVENIKYLKDTPALNGVQFPATQVASANANTLDDYEEGTWTPSLSGGTGGSVTYGAQVGFYTKIGRMVYVSANILASAWTHTGGSLYIAGLPFAADSTTNGRFVGTMDWYALNTAKLAMVGKVQPGAVQADIETLGAAAVSLGASALTGADLANGSALQLTLTYMAAS